MPANGRWDLIRRLKVNSEWGQVSINIRQQDHSETDSMYCIIKCIVRGKQARVKNADLRHPSCAVVMQKRKICVTRPQRDIFKAYVVYSLNAIFLNIHVS